MTEVFFDMGISLDGFITGANRSVENPMGDGGPEMHEWAFSQEAFPEGDGSETGKDNEIVKATFERIGASVMGKNMFDEGEANWPDNAPFHCPVYVLSHVPREPWERPGGTTFHFVTDGIERALEQAREAAGDKDVRISGGANTIQQYLNAGDIDEFTLHVAPVFLGSGLHLFEGIDKTKVDVEIAEVISSTQITHMTYNVVT